MFKRSLFLLLFTASSIHAEEAVIKSCDTDECVNYFQQYKKYAKKGYADALSGVGEMYYHGYGTDRNTELAIKNLKRGARYGSKTAGFKLGYIYLIDKEIMDVDLSIKYLKQSARKGYSEASIMLTAVFLDPAYDRVDYDEVDKWLAKAYKARNPKSTKFIEFIYNADNIDMKDFPKISEVIEAYGVKTTEEGKSDYNAGYASINWPESDIETITVTAPSMQEYMDDELNSLSRNYSPDRFNAGTGSRIQGQTCAKMISCGKADKDDIQRMNLYSGQAILTQSLFNQGSGGMGGMTRQ